MLTTLGLTLGHGSIFACETKIIRKFAGVGDQVKRGLAVLRSFIGALKVTLRAMADLGPDAQRSSGIADK